VADTPPSSDIGRRIRHRRDELGLSLEQAARAAAMDPGYLAYLEATPEPEPSRATLIRLATALATSVPGLLGGDRLQPPGAHAEAVPAVMVELDRHTCLELLAAGGVGRCVLADDRGPVALPVNFGVFDGDVVFRTAGGTSIARGALAGPISFEVDQVDDAIAEGWSVLVTGTARLVEDEAELHAVEALEIHPWAPGERQRYFRLAAEQVTGRQIRRP
jgi:nitroimidazol reductase NimA-like FMN-containing flavoprotein (pyridoxamine 5'-phosphate oxidase superfamily)